MYAFLCLRVFLCLCVFLCLHVRVSLVCVQLSLQTMHDLECFINLCASSHPLKTSLSTILKPPSAALILSPIPSPAAPTLGLIMCRALAMPAHAS